MSNTDGSKDLPRRNVFIADTGNHCVRMVGSDGVITTVVGTPTTIGGPNGQGEQPLATMLNSPYGVEVDAHGNLWIADTRNSVIRLFVR